jgi:hypothetical protein
VSGDEAVPLACTLEAGSLVERIAAWRALVESSVRGVETDDASVGLVLDDSEAAMVAAVLLGEAEKRCCAFFDVTLELDGDRRVLRLTVPAGAEDVLRTFAEAISA